MGAAGKGAVQRRMLDILDAHPYGVMSAAISDETGMDANRVATRMGELRDAGRILAVRIGGVGNRLRWFALQYRLQAEKFGAIEAAKKRQQVRNGQNSQKPTRAQTSNLHKRSHAVVLKDDGPADVSRAKMTVCPSGTGNRFTPTTVEPFFSAMKPGQYPFPAMSASARIAGEPEQVAA